MGDLGLGFFCFGLIFYGGGFIMVFSFGGFHLVGFWKFDLSHTFSKLFSARDEANPHPPHTRRTSG